MPGICLAVYAKDLQGSAVANLTHLSYQLSRSLDGKAQKDLLCGSQEGA